MKNLLVLIVTIVIFAGIGFACDDTVPGAMPPAPHGGVVEPMRVPDLEDRAEETEEREKAQRKVDKKPDEIFVEGRYRNKEVRLYPLSIVPPKVALFSAISPTDFTEVQAKVEFPYEGKTMDLPVTINNGAFAAPLDADYSHRFFIYLNAKHHGVAKRVKIQLENE